MMPVDERLLGSAGHRAILPVRSIATQPMYRLRDSMCREGVNVR